MDILKIVKSLNNLPSTIEPNTIYFNLKPNGVEIHVSDKDGLQVLPATSEVVSLNVTYPKNVQPGAKARFTITDYDVNKNYNISCIRGNIVRLESEFASGDFVAEFDYKAPIEEGPDTITINDTSFIINVFKTIIEKPVIVAPSNPYESQVSLDTLELTLFLSNYVTNDPDDKLSEVYVRVYDPIYDSDFRSFSLMANGSTISILNPVISNLFTNSTTESLFEISVKYRSDSGIESEFSDILKIFRNEPVPINSYIPILDPYYPDVLGYGTAVVDNIQLKIKTDYEYTNPELGALVDYYFQIAKDYEFNNLIFDQARDYDSINFNSNTNIANFTNSFEYNTEYFARVHCRFQNINSDTVWSSIHSFRTRVMEISSVLNLKFDSGVTDLSGTNKQIQVMNGAYITSSQTLYSYNSLRLDGVNSYLTIPSHEDFNFGTGDFVVQAFTYQESNDTGGVVIARQENSNNAVLQLTIANQKLYGFIRSNGGSDFIQLNSSDTAVIRDQWNHVALIRESNVIMLSLNGIIIHARNNAMANITMNRPLTIGVLDDGLMTSYYKGYIEDILIKKNEAYYDPKALNPNPSEPDTYKYVYQTYSNLGQYMADFNTFAAALNWYCNWWNSGSSVGNVTCTIRDIDPINGSINYILTSDIYGQRIDGIKAVKIML